MTSGVRWARFRGADGLTGFGQLADAGLAVHEGELFGESRASGRVLPPGTFTLLAPCVPSKIIALWNNFHELGAKLGKQAPAHPLFLIKPASTLLGTGERILRPARYAGKIVFEGELGIVIGRQAKNLSVEQAAAAIFGYTCVNDVTAAETLKENADFDQWCRAKGHDTFCPLGPVIATGLDVAAARVVTRVNGDVRQDYPLSDMIMPPALLVSRLSGDMTLLPGDVIACGTSVGVGSMKDGSTVEVSIAGIGTLHNVLAAA
jgi:2-keto-4-pentenoate hydratase/2-oxohepta-3-ene-1,7-dioic acid hydratase in catechol pathway